MNPLQKPALLAVFFSLFVLLHTSSCKKDDPVGEPGDLISYELIDSLGLEEIDQIRTVLLDTFLESANLKGDVYKNRLSQPKYAVKLYKVTYRSYVPEQGNKPTVATGLVAIPVVASSNLPLISYHHGTVFGKEDVPSVFTRSGETQFMVLQFASQGYMLMAADYFGLGDSDEPNSYSVRYSTEQACLDLYKATRKVLEDQQITMDRFFINGWSQGGYNTMLMLRRYERENIRIDACFTAAASVDPTMFLTRMLFNRRPFDAIYTPGVLTNIMFAQETYNDLDDVTSRYIKPKYLPYAKDLYEFRIDFLGFLSKVPPSIDSVFTEEYFEDAMTASAPFWRTVERSEAYRWRSPTPLRAYYGLRDEAVPAENARRAVDYMVLLGKTDAEAINAGDLADHRNTYIESLIDAKPWIDSFR